MLISSCGKSFNIAQGSFFSFSMFCWFDIFQATFPKRDSLKDSDIVSLVTIITGLILWNIIWRILPGVVQHYTARSCELPICAPSRRDACWAHGPDSPASGACVSIPLTAVYTDTHYGVIITDWYYSRRYGQPTAPRATHIHSSTHIRTSMHSHISMPIHIKQLPKPIRHPHL